MNLLTLYLVFFTIVIFLSSNSKSASWPLASSAIENFYHKHSRRCFLLFLVHSFLKYFQEGENLSIMPQNISLFQILTSSDLEYPTIIIRSWVWSTGNLLSTIWKGKEYVRNIFCHSTLFSIILTQQFFPKFLCTRVSYIIVIIKIYLIENEECNTDTYKNHYPTFALPLDEK